MTIEIDYERFDRSELVDLVHDLTVDLRRVVRERNKALRERDRARDLAVRYEAMLHMTPEERDLFTKPRFKIMDLDDAS